MFYYLNLKTSTHRSWVGDAMIVGTEGGRKSKSLNPKLNNRVHVNTAEHVLYEGFFGPHS